MDRNDDLGGPDALAGTGGTPGLGGSGLDAGGLGTGGPAGAAGAGGVTAGDTDDFGVYDVQYYRGHFDSNPARPETHTYEQARTGYQAGHAAASTPAYAGRPFAEVEGYLERAYPATETTRWDQVRDYARHGFEWKTVVGGLALAAGGWWAGKQIVEALRTHNNEDEKHYRAHFESHPARQNGMTYDHARTGYVVGYTAARNPAYAGRSYTEVETDLRRGFTGANANEYEVLRDFCEAGYNRGVGASGSAGVSGGTGTTGGLGGSGLGSSGLGDGSPALGGAGGSGLGSTGGSALGSTGGSGLGSTGVSGLGSTGGSGAGTLGTTGGVTGDRDGGGGTIGSGTGTGGPGGGTGGSGTGGAGIGGATGGTGTGAAGIGGAGFGTV
ncbi:hypothetical protein [Longimicrobium terrae]|uniref:Uncharacterized protein n=1 Tax=Longimicrobium terrae TaxID=1639882 RepID=A0A841H2I4_9BACT|nr:hypothetical protein [Longimicrobium terrae]MBB4637963.1 hypothetical protein [Longimicrobium terrae]MBB6072210.1 hypothetical protein [Longimicrobium terrae]NNC28364.1 hypothetical protein [Longimicrobium terrae]